MAYEVKDSGKREEFEGGMVRDTTEGKTDYMLVFDGPMFKRWAEHLTKGAKKYSKRNWMKAQGMAELEHAMESLGHHFIQYVEGEQDEDHAAAIFFNINLIEYIKTKQQVTFTLQTPEPQSQNQATSPCLRGLLKS